MEKKYLTIKEVAKILGVTTQTLRNWDRSGKFRAYRNPLNDYRVYKIEQVELFLRKVESGRSGTKKIFLG